jgi:hypothetical protein
MYKLKSVTIILGVMLGMVLHGEANAWRSRTPAPAPTTTTTTTTAVSYANQQMYGITIDDISGLTATTAALSQLSKKPTTRIVFDEWQPASGYRNAAVAINKVSYVMGEILDSSAMDQYTVQQYLNRTSEYMAALGDVVNIWEIGNEINGEWLGKNADVVAKMTGAYDLVKGQGKTAALTLYYNQDCWSNPANEMFTWANANIPARMKTGLDYVLVSYYEEDCNGLVPDWNAVFTKLSAMFPNSKVGFGETGTTTTNKAAYLTRYYTLKPPVKNYIGGYFWWYGKEDLVPSTQPLWSTFNNVLSGS